MRAEILHTKDKKTEEETEPSDEGGNRTDVVQLLKSLWESSSLLTNWKMWMEPVMKEGTEVVQLLKSLQESSSLLTNWKMCMAPVMKEGTKLVQPLKSLQES